ncbi:MAG: hypothetical protein KDB98_04320 [Flavobacteriales bacterium]|nr:hypothetical protein [Flavobacteriales bacterium]
MPSFAHIINIFSPPSDSDLVLAQEVTIESMVRAKEQASSTFEVDLLSCQTEKDRPLIPESFRATQDLNRSVLNKGPFKKQLELPVLRDILDRLYNESEAEYLIFTNVDIGLQPDFYLQVKQFIDAGHDAFMINRRRIPASYDSVQQLDEMYKEKGLKHPGFDCFVFHRDLYKKFSLAEVVIGVPFIEITLSQNLFCFAKNPKVYTDEHLTFHIGLEIFKKRAPKEFWLYNQKEFWKAMQNIWNHLDSRKWPHGNEFILIRLLRWGLHPCFPIRLALKLEPRRWLRQTSD